MSTRTTHEYQIVSTIEIEQAGPAITITTLKNVVEGESFHFTPILTTFERRFPGFNAAQQRFDL